MMNFLIRTYYARPLWTTAIGISRLNVTAPASYACGQYEYSN